MTAILSGLGLLALGFVLGVRAGIEVQARKTLGPLQKLSADMRSAVEQIRRDREARQ